MQSVLCVFFELSGQSKVATLASGEPNETHDYTEATLTKLSPSRILYVVDKRKGCDYLIDTGAAVSVLPQACANRTATPIAYPSLQQTTRPLLPTVGLHVSE